MLPQYVLLSLIAACAAVPLNINLGAYSPALVVGDGEISLGSKESASELMATLATGANAAAGQQEGQQQAEVQTEVVQPPAPAPEGEAVQQEAGEQPQAEQPAEEPAAAKRSIETQFGKRAPAVDEKLAAIEGAMQWIKRDLAGFNAALSYAGEAMKNTPKIEMGSEGVGVGLVISPGLNVPANSAANGKPAEKRSEVVAEESDSPKITLVSITEV